MRSLCCGLLLGLFALGSLGLAPSRADAQLLPWRRPRYYYPPVVYSNAPPIYATPAAVSSYAPPVYATPAAVSYYYLPAASYYPPPVAYYGPPDAATAPAYYGSTPASYTPVPGSFTSSSSYYQPPPGPAVNAAIPGPTINLAVHDGAFEPETINVFAGTTVQWHNQGRDYHTVTSDQGLFDSGQVGPGTAFRYTFNQPGSYPYHCALHPREMHGTIVVQ